jgi:glycine/D-amino acid oxidase-like deaminating enzyme
VNAVGEADAVVVGAGALGAATAFHLMRRGLRTVLVDRTRPVEETSPRAAGLGMQIQPSDELMAINRLAIDKIVNFRDETGQPLTVHRSGSLKVARREPDEAQLRDEVERARRAGVGVEIVTTAEARALAPWLDGERARAIWFAPGDVYFAPGDLPRAYVAALHAGGAEVRAGAPVERLERVGGGVTRVVTSAGAIEAPAVVLAAGAWLPLLAGLLDATVPLWPVRHQLCITLPHPSIGNHQPAVRIMDAKTYTRPCDGGLMFGAYEPDPLPVDPREQPSSFRITDLELDPEPLRRKIADVALELPLLASSEWAVHRGGLPTMTPDGGFVADRLETAPGVWVLGGCNVSGLSTSPALGEHLASWIATGRRPAALAPFGLGRFADRYDDAGRLRDACVGTYADRYSYDEVRVH